MIETRNVNAIVAKVGGNAGSNTLNYKISIPSAWAKQLGITKEDKSLSINFDGKQIVIQKLLK